MAISPPPRLLRHAQVERLPGDRPPAVDVVGVEQRPRRAEDREALDRLVGEAAAEDRVADTHVHPLLLGGDDARIPGQFVGRDDRRPRQERLDDPVRDAGNRIPVTAEVAHGRRQPDHVTGRGGLAAGEFQPRPAVALDQAQRLPRIDEVRVCDLRLVHPPQFRPAPRAGEEDARDVPQRVAALDGVGIGRVGGQRRQRDAELRDLAGRLPLLLGDRVADRGRLRDRDGRAGEAGGRQGHLAGAQRGTADGLLEREH